MGATVTSKFSTELNAQLELLTLKWPPATTSTVKITGISTSDHFLSTRAETTDNSSNARLNFASTKITKTLPETVSLMSVPLSWQPTTLTKLLLTTAPTMLYQLSNGPRSLCQTKKI